jgi:hypothetical protein
VRLGSEVPGDIGRAVQGFEEARELSRDPVLTNDATRALAVLRSEVARRRVRAGEPVEVDPGRSLTTTIARVLREDAWSIISMGASIALAMALFARWLTRARRVRVSGGVTAGVAAPVLVLAIAMTVAARHDRIHVREAVVVAPNARPYN